LQVQTAKSPPPFNPPTNIRTQASAPNPIETAIVSVLWQTLIRDCLKILRVAAARDFGCGQGGEVRASPQRAVRTEPTQSTGKRPAARRVFAQKALWLRCSSVTERRWLCSFVAPRQRAFCTKTAPLIIFRQSLNNTRLSVMWCFRSAFYTMDIGRPDESAAPEA